MIWGIVEHVFAENVVWGVVGFRVGLSVRIVRYADILVTADILETAEILRTAEVSLNRLPR